MRLRHARGFTLIELLIVVAIIGIVAAIAVPQLLRARLSGNEASAVGSLRAINSGQATYASSCAKGGYAVSLSDLARPPSSGEQPFISPDLASDGVSKSGYTFNLAAEPASVGLGTVSSSCNGTQAMSSYYASAKPLTNKTGTRSFATDTRGAIFTTTGSVPPANPIPPTATPLE